MEEFKAGTNLRVSQVLFTRSRAWDLGRVQLNYWGGAPQGKLRREKSQKIKEGERTGQECGLSWSLVFSQILGVGAEEALPRQGTPLVTQPRRQEALSCQRPAVAASRWAHWPREGGLGVASTLPAQAGSCPRYQHSTRSTYPQDHFGLCVTS